MKVVITGGAGFIGATLCRTLVERPGVDHVVVLDDLSTGNRANLANVNVDLVIGSVLDRDLLAEVVHDAGSVVHLAAIASVAASLQDPRSTNEVNVTGTVNVLEAARAGGAHVVVASSSAVYGRNSQVPTHEALRCDPMTPYAVSKLAAETYALAYARCYETPVLAFRFFNVYGPGQPADHAYAAVVPAFVDAALDGRPLPLEGDGRQTRDFVYVGGVADVIADSVVGRISHDGPVNLAFGAQKSLLELIDDLGQVLGRPLTIDRRPPRTGDVRHSQADTTVFRGLFPGAQPAPLREGLAATVAWMGSVRGDRPA